MPAEPPLGTAPYGGVPAGHVPAFPFTQPGAAPPTAAPRSNVYHDVASPGGGFGQSGGGHDHSGGPQRAFFDENVAMAVENKYSEKDPQLWLETITNYLVG